MKTYVRSEHEIDTVRLINAVRMVRGVLNTDHFRHDTIDGFGSTFSPEEFYHFSINNNLVYIDIFGLTQNEKNEKLDQIGVYTLTVLDHTTNLSILQQLIQIAYHNSPWQSNDDETEI